MKFSVTLLIDAPIERVFDLCRSTDLHVETQIQSNEQVIGGRMEGLLSANEEVTWSAKHFGFRMKHVARITAFERPTRFQDTMTKGMFKSFVHDHVFEEVSGKTKVTDVLVFESPFGVIGKIVDTLILRNYLERLIEKRVQMIRTVAESETWSKYLPDSI